MILVGLTGGIGSGKSTVSALLAQRGAVIIDADAIVHELQEPGQPVFDEIVEEFGPGVRRSRSAPWTGRRWRASCSGTPTGWRH